MWYRIFVFAILLFPAFLFAQNKFYSVEGKVFIEGTKIPLKDAHVNLENIKGEKKIIKTDKNGFYRFDSLSPGNYEIRITKKGYFNSEELAFTITNKRIKLKNLFLQKQELTDDPKPIIFEPFSSDSFDQQWQIDSIAKFLKEYKLLKVTIYAYADSCEVANNDTILSYKRGLTIKNLIVAKEIKPKRLIIKPLIGKYDFKLNKNDCTIEGIKEREFNRSVHFSVRR